MRKMIVSYEPIYIQGKGQYAACTLECGHRTQVRVTRSTHIVSGVSKVKCKVCTNHQRIAI